MSEAGSRTVGSFPSWLGLRFAQVIFFVLLPFAVLEQLPEDAPYVAKLGGVALATALLSMAAYFWHPIAYADAGNDGLFVRRYLKLHFVPWAEIESVNWNPQQFNVVIVKLHRKISGSRNFTFFIPNVGLKELGSYLRGERTPEIVLWLGTRVQ